MIQVTQILKLTLESNSQDVFFYIKLNSVIYRNNLDLSQKHVNFTGRLNLRLIFYGYKNHKKFLPQLINRMNWISSQKFKYYSLTRI